MYKNIALKNLLAELFFNNAARAYFYTCYFIFIYFYHLIITNNVLHFSFYILTV